MSDYEEIKKDLEQYELDTESKIEGVYNMPGSSGYVPNTEIKVHMVETDFKTDDNLENPKEDHVTDEFDEVIANPILEEEITETPTVEEDILEESFEDVTDFQSSTPHEEDNYYPQNQTTGYGDGQKSRGGIPKASFIGLGLVVLGLIAFLFLKGGGKSNKFENQLVGQWTPFAFQQGDSVAALERDSKEFYFIDFQKDNTLTLSSEGREFKGTWKLEDKKEVLINIESDESFDGTYEDGVFTIDIGFGSLYFNKIGSKPSDKEEEIMDMVLADNNFAELSEGEEVSTPAVSVNEPSGGPVHKPEKVLDTKEDLIGEWIGVVMELGHYGPEYEDMEMQLYDLDAVIDIDETGQYYFEAYMVDSIEESPLVSTYIEMEEEYFIAKIGEEDAWIADHWLTPDEEGIISAYYDDPTTLYIQYEYEDYEAENSGFHLSFYFRKVGESWNDMPFKPSSLE